MAEAETRTLMTKGQFAQLKNRAPSAVSNWITRGTISPSAVVGQGQRAKIWVEQAERDLASLDAGEQDKQPAPILAPANLPVGTDDLARKRKADADAAETLAEERKRRLAADSGRWIEADEARRQWSSELAKLIADLDVFITSTMAVELAAEFSLDPKACQVKARELFRSYREGVADTAAINREERLEALAEAAE